MKFNLNSKSLEKLLSEVIHAVPLRTTLPILENFLFEIDESILTVTATDMEITLRSTISVASDEKITFVVPAKFIYDIVKSLGDTTIHFETESNNKLTLKTDFGVYSIGYIVTDEFPLTQEINEENKVEISGKNLKKALDQTTFAISKEAMRPAMMGTLFEFSGDGLKFVTTDGHRLVKFILKDLGTELSAQLIIPEKAVTVLSKLISEETVKILFGESNIAFFTNGIELITRLIASKYPDYKSVIPIENENTLKVKRSELSSSIRRMLLFSTTNFQQVKLSITSTNLEVSAEDFDHGSNAKENILCEYNGDQMDIGFNTGYLNDILNHLNYEELLFKFNSPTKACIIEPVSQPENEDLMMLLMPVRLNS